LIAIRNNLIKKAFGGAMPNISQNVIKNLIIPLPPLTEQKRISEILKEQMAASEKARKAAEEELATINSLPAAILRKAFNGEI
ncbi:MAG: restriction endonuclease subunit S, partial [Methanosarcina sp.]|nr:restriction endonuclease subunit S [Methanosarcina sp.]